VTAAAWRNAQLYAELEERSRTDTLTGLHNARWWQEIAPMEAARSRRSGAEIGLLLIDLDHFKQVNDTAGHPVGDRVLRQVASALRSAVRAGDAVIRFGGEEFLIMLPDSGQDGALRVAENVREQLARLTPAAPGLPRTTASIGVALYPRHGDSLDDVVQVADAAMYRAKGGSRRCGHRLLNHPRAPPALQASVVGPSSGVRAWDHLKEAVPAGGWLSIPLGPAQSRI
jgi:diguanylate cyclase (GGDEF)-like protein